MDDLDLAFLNEHKEHIEKTVSLLRSTMSRDCLNDAEKLGVATMVMNIYNGMEIILRHVLLCMGVEHGKTGAWHKELLNGASLKGIITPELHEKLLVILQFRHRHAHGYGYMAEWDKVCSIARDAGDVVDEFFGQMKQRGIV